MPCTSAWQEQLVPLQRFPGAMTGSIAAYRQTTQQKHAEDPKQQGKHIASRLQIHLSSNLGNLVEPVHHIVQKLELTLTQATKIQRPWSPARLDDARNVLQVQKIHALISAASTPLQLLLLFAFNC